MSKQIYNNRMWNKQIYLENPMYALRLPQSSDQPLVVCLRMDIVGPLPIGMSQKKLMLIATDCFSKWVEVESYANVKDKDVTKLV